MHYIVFYIQNYYGTLSSLGWMGDGIKTAPVHLAHKTPTLLY